jgi:hypothetical protein
MIRSLIAPFLLLLLCPACFVNVRTSSRDFLSESDSRYSTPASTEQVTKRLMELMSKRGMNLVDRKELEAGKVMLKFKGDRETMKVGESSSAQVGSAYFAIIQGREGGGTIFTLFGKPTYMGREVCTEHDSTLFQCADGQDLKSLLQVPANMNGRAESETIRGVISELSMDPQ